MRGLGTLVNVAPVIGGTIVGVLLGGRVPERVRASVLGAVGVVTLGVGLRSFLETRNAVFPVVAIVLGTLLGEALGVERRLEGAGEWIRRRVQGGRADVEPRPASFVERGRDELDIEAPADAPPPGDRFVDGFVTASLTFCVGALTIVGSLQDGISGDSQLLVVKAALDGLVAIVFTTAFGWGVGFSAVSILVLQGTITAVGAVAGDTFLSDRMVQELEATGGVMILAIGLRLLDIRKLPVGSYLPGLAVAPALVALFAR